MHSWLLQRIFIRSKKKMITVNTNILSIGSTSRWRYFVNLNDVKHSQFFESKVHFKHYKKKMHTVDEQKSQPVQICHCEVETVIITFLFSILTIYITTTHKLYRREERSISEKSLSLISMQLCSAQLCRCDEWEVLQKRWHEKWKFGFFY